MSSNSEYTLWDGRALVTLTPAETTRLDIGATWKKGPLIAFPPFRKLSAYSPHNILFFVKSG
ncbi:hypothetical protein Ga0100231_007150 [Opitutaceae bacterium TAV4]|uniref:hypothetical protein n=1 Tax=Geminisphaera colitermitum TaxID=1148786 RepID=UPI000F62ADB1|nr:hypothetical protein [Geminisphaera colitermitum]RRJ95597.1 hypothetical protein Ga0100231_016215 [Opitutaceae bacterium TAV4]RRJ98156.1 hypothetical protein Ga0100231_007150 [Opitutaceae bacterium TAV4]RRJ99900.1 hypothetical protein Ga0100230_017930 [Opitutaceae bacterium TAV3]